MPTPAFCRREQSNGHRQLRDYLRAELRNPHVPAFQPVYAKVLMLDLYLIINGK
jgi:hypothetical protein